MERKGSDDNSYYLYILPISGGGIVSHLALLQEVYDARLKANNDIKGGYFSYAPHIVMGSSGGNISAFIAQSADWTSDGIERNVMHMNSELFLKKWVPNELPLIPNLPIGLLKGSLYNQGCGANSLFRRIFTSESIQRSELWLGTYDIKHKKAQFFCNRNPSNSYISEPFFNEEQSLYFARPLIFTGGDVDMLADISVASATIPATVPSKEIKGLLYADGGVMYSSPFSVLHKEIMRIVTGKEKVPLSRSFQIENNSSENYEYIYSEDEIKEEKNLRLFYFFPYQPNGLEYPNKNKDLGIRTYLDSILNVSMIQDRNTAYELINSLSPEGLETETFIDLDSDRLSTIIKFLNTKKHYLICIFPHRNPSINIIHIDGESMRREMKKVRQGYGCQVWYSKKEIN